MVLLFNLMMLLSIICYERKPFYNMNKVFSTLLILVVISLINQELLVAQSDSTKDKKVQLAAIPTIGYNNSFGFQLGAMAILMFDVNKQDTISPASSVVGMGFYTTNHTYFGVLAQRLFFNEDNWRIIAAFGQGNINFQFYAGDFPNIGGIYVDYTTVSTFGYVEVNRRVYDRLYSGLNFMTNKLNTEFYLEDILGGNPDSLKVLNGLGIPITWDSKDDVYNAYNGLEVKLKTVFNNKALGSDLDFNTFSLEANYYTEIGTKAVLASRATFYTGLGEVPFEGLRAIGRNDIRGYSNGKYRGDNVYTLQTEYRYNLPKRFGLVAFAGIAAAYNSLNDSEDKWSGLLPGIGIGGRFMLIEERRLNMGIDVALGKEDWGLYFRLGEAF